MITGDEGETKGLSLALLPRWVSDAGHAGLSTGTRAGVRKRPRNETAGTGAPGGAPRAMGNWLAPSVQRRAGETDADAESEALGHRNASCAASAVLSAAIEEMRYRAPRVMRQRRETSHSVNANNGLVSGQVAACHRAERCSAVGQLRSGIPVANSYGFFHLNGTVGFSSSFLYWTARRVACPRPATACRI